MTRVAIDVGGTFTDCLVLDQQGKLSEFKALTTPADASRGLMECLEKGDEYCPYCSVCTQISVWDRAQSLLVNYLASVTISNIADQSGLRERLISLHG